MRDLSEKRAVELSWDKVRSIVSEEIREVLGVPVQCRVNVVDGSFWDVTFIGSHLRRTGKMLCLMRVAQMSAALESCWLRN